VNALIVALVVLVAAAGSAVVLTRDPKLQAITLSAFGIMLTLLFLVVQAADVALSELVINALIVPLIILLTVAKVRDHR
jgi:uncharacterized MnhB-related membrane protein